MKGGVVRSQRQENELAIRELYPKATYMQVDLHANTNYDKAFCGFRVPARNVELALVRNISIRPASPSNTPQSGVL